MPKHIAELHDANWLKNAYSHKTSTEIANELGCTAAGVLVAVRRHGITPKKPWKTVSEKLTDLAWLSETYKKYTTHQIAAMLHCNQSTVCEALKRANIPRLGRGKRPSEKTKYRMKLVNGRLRSRHRLAMEKHLGRRLETWEHVHHIDGNGLNNELSNLVVLSQSEHHRLHAKYMKSWMSKYNYKRFSHRCKTCKTEFVGGNRAKFCPTCRPRKK